MDTQHEERPGRRMTLQQLLHALNEELFVQTASGQLASDLGGVRLDSARFVLTQPSHRVPSSVTWSWRSNVHFQQSGSQ